MIGESGQRVDAGTTLVQQAGEAIGGIVAIAGKVRTHIGEIEHAASEQAEGVGQVNTAVGTIDEMTQHNAALAEELSAAAHSLRERARLLGASVQVFQLR